MKILIVDDNDDDLRLLRYTLEVFGHEVVTACNGEEGLRAAAHISPDLIVSDVLMPVMDGFEFLRNVRKTSSIPFIFHSAVYDDSRDRQFAKALGADAYLVKPLDPTEVMKQIERALDTGKGAPPAPVAEDDDFLRDHSRVVVAKLTDKVLELEMALAERKQAEEEVRRLQNHLANIIDSMPSILVGIAPDASVTQWNRAAELHTGIGTGEALGRPVCSVLPDFAPWISMLLGRFEQGRPAFIEKLVRELGGRIRFFDLMVYQVGSDAADGAVVRIEEVTEQVRMQKAMIQTEKMMSLGGLAAGMAHEINNPLGIIVQAANNIKRRLSDELPANRRAAEELGFPLDWLAPYLEKRQIGKLIDSIDEAATRAAQIIDNVLRFGCRAGSTMDRHSLGAVMEKALELAANDYDLKKKADFRDVEIVRDFPPGMPDVPMIAVEIEQVALNLLKNASQALTANPSDRKPRIVLRIRQEERYAVVEVEDNGPGMPEDVRRRVFEPFFTTKPPGSGTGLGLSVSYMIVTRNHKGLMEVDTAPGSGARFTVKLPLSTEGGNE